MASVFTVSAGESVFKISKLSDHSISVDGSEHEFDIAAVDDRTFSLILDGKAFVIQMPQRVSPNGAAGSDDLGRTVDMTIGGQTYSIRVDDEHSLLVKSLIKKPLAAAGLQIIKAPMPGLISRIEGEIGDEVPAGKGLLVLEAMKMENEIRSIQPGRIKFIHVEIGKAVEKGEPLVTLSEV